MVQPISYPCLGGRQKNCIKTMSSPAPQPGKVKLVDRVWEAAEALPTDIVCGLVSRVAAQLSLLLGTPTIVIPATPN
jgi:hypothetical protein